jgi:hypothetical protein
MTYKLFLDDERFPPGDASSWCITRDYGSTIAMIEAFGCPELISFDHDLGEGPSGYDVARWLIETDLNYPGFLPHNFQFTIHSQNPIGAANIKGLLTPYLKQKQ